LSIIKPASESVFRQVSLERDGSAADDWDIVAAGMQSARQYALNIGARLESSIVDKVGTARVSMLRRAKSASAPAAGKLLARISSPAG